ncbi:MAG: hypothetical protein JOZ51_22070 [Chloroflexi bacterium]|nr:hypothetical protein [Chloroflexota bacterium]
MFNSIVAHLTDMIPSLAHALAPVFGDHFDDDHAVSTLTEDAPDAALAEDQDRRQVFIGHWEASGIKVVEGKELPYVGYMYNSWDLDKSWLVLDFKETNPPVGKAFKEDQYWGFTKETGVHTRPMMTSIPGFALVTSMGWVGDASSWTGTYDVGGTRLDLTETITLFGRNKFRMYGEMFIKGKSVGLYDITCTRKRQGNHHDATPTV